MTDFEEMAVITEKEIEKLYNFQKFNQFICLCNIYHINHCEHDNCNNCNFVNKPERIFFENYPGEVNGTEPYKIVAESIMGTFFL